MLPDLKFIPDTFFRQYKRICEKFPNGNADPNVAKSMIQKISQLMVANAQHELSQDMFTLETCLSMCWTVLIFRKPIENILTK